MLTEEKKGVCKRLKEVRLALSATQQTIAEAMGYKKSQVISDTERYRRFIPTRRLNKLCAAFPQISLEYALYGIGEPLLLTDDAAPCPKNKRVRRTYNKPEYETLSKPLLSRIVRRATNTKTLTELIAHETNADNMSPTIKPGDTLIIRPIALDSNMIINGAIYAVKIKGSFCLRRVQSDPVGKKHRFYSDNPKTQEIIESIQTSYVGRIVQIIRKL
jgi:transcriptional regulator with XRE-family HTH domain